MKLTQKCIKPNLQRTKFTMKSEMNGIHKYISSRIHREPSLVEAGGNRGGVKQSCSDYLFGMY